TCSTDRSFAPSVIEWASAQTPPDLTPAAEVSPQCRKRTAGGKPADRKAKRHNDRAHSSVRLERIPDKDEVRGSSPRGPTIHSPAETTRIGSSPGQTCRFQVSPHLTWFFTHRAPGFH